MFDLHRDPNKDFPNPGFWEDVTGTLKLALIVAAWVAIVSIVLYTVTN